MLPPRDTVTATAARRRATDRKDADLRDRRDELRPAERIALAPPPLDAPHAAAVSAPPEIRALVRALPVAIESACSRDGESIALSFGRSLGVEIRATPGGVDLVLHPDARLSRAAAAELPGLVAALRARGVTVARAEVRARGDGAMPSGHAGRSDAARPRSPGHPR